MSSSTQEISVKANMELGQVVDYLEALISSLKSGKVYMEQGGKVVTLTPTDDMDVEIEAGEKKGKQKFSLELVWRKRAVTTGDVGLTISATMPETVDIDEPEISETETDEAEEDFEDDENEEDEGDEGEKEETVA